MSTTNVLYLSPVADIHRTDIRELLVCPTTPLVPRPTLSSRLQRNDIRSLLPPPPYDSNGQISSTASRVLRPRPSYGTSSFSELSRSSLLVQRDKEGASSIDDNITEAYVPFKPSCPSIASSVGTKTHEPVRRGSLIDLMDAMQKVSYNSRAA